jgi:hypothetical protein
MIAMVNGGNAQMHERAVARVLALPLVRPEAVTRARDLLRTPRWCRADEVAAELVTCLVERKLP